MSDNLINLTKQVKITLEKRKAPTIITQVGVAFDISGSTQGFYTGVSRTGDDSYIQNLVDRMFAIACTFDDNEALNTWVFDSTNSQTDDIVKKNYEHYVEKNILKNSHIHKWGSTNFHDVMTAINKYYNFPDDDTPKVSKLKSFFGFGKKKPETAAPAYTDPAYILFITDGAPDSEEAAEAAIAKTSNDRIYWQFAGIDNGNAYHFLKRLAAKYPNVSYELISPTKTSDAELYDKLISPKFVDWYTALPK